MGQGVHTPKKAGSGVECYSTSVLRFLNQDRGGDEIVIRSLISHFVCSGAGQEVGRSCIMLEFKGKKIMVSI